MHLVTLYTDKSCWHWRFLCWSFLVISVPWKVQNPWKRQIPCLHHQLVRHHQSLPILTWSDGGAWPVTTCAGARGCGMLFWQSPVCLVTTGGFTCFTVEGGPLWESNITGNGSGTMMCCCNGMRPPHEPGPNKPFTANYAQVHWKHCSWLFGPFLNMQRCMSRKLLPLHGRTICLNYTYHPVLAWIGPIISWA